MADHPTPEEELSGSTSLSDSNSESESETESDFSESESEDEGQEDYKRGMPNDFLLSFIERRLLSINFL